jgi:hypothetical protein
MTRRMTVHGELLPMDARQITRRPTFDADFPRGNPEISTKNPNNYTVEVARFPLGNYYTMVDSGTDEYVVYRYPGSREGAAL